MVMNLYMNEGFPKVQGVSGAKPPSRGKFWLRKGSNVLAAFARDHVPQMLDEIGGGETPEAVFKGPELPMGVQDAWAWTHASAAGFGDPLLRDLQLIQCDLDEGILDDSTAARVYGAMVKEGLIDVEGS
jgi:N-methylhydantoinase B